MRRKSKKSQTEKSAPAPMSDMDRYFQTVAESKKTLRKGNETVEMSIQEVVVETMTQSALKGGPHSIGHWLAYKERVDEKRAGEIAKSVAAWQTYKSRKMREIEGARAAGLPEPEVLPHPDDVQIDHGKGVTITGPLTQACLDQERKLRRTVEAWLFQDALDRKLEKRTSDTSAQLGDPLTIALLCNRGLSTRLRFTQDELIARRMRLRSMTKPELLKQTRQAWKRAGLDVRRSTRSPSPKDMMSIIGLCRDVVALYSDGTKRISEQERGVDEAIVKWFG